MSSEKYDGLAWEITLGVAGGILLASFISAIKGLDQELADRRSYGHLLLI